ncbi:MAG: mechanosensitive ion channel, partial [Eubacterium sp.]|nr:mechanosensitive ion channel [Eubacterium sp.]
MENLLNTVSKFIAEHSSTLHIAGGIIAALLFFLFRNKLAKGVLNLFSLILFKNAESKRNALKKSLQKPFAAFFVVLGLFLAVYINFKFPSVIKSFKIAVILLICWGLVNYLSDNLFLHLHFDNNSEKINTTAVKFISNILKIIIVMFAVVMVISELGYNINGLITGIGVGGLAVSLAAQDAISNLIAGFVIVLEKPFVEGEFIQAKDLQGTV